MGGTSTLLGTGHRVLLLEEADSTNMVALQLAARGERGPMWVMARRQTAGRGRSGRPWTSEAGNLFASLVAVLDVAPRSAAQLSLVAGVAVADAIATLAPDRAELALRLKWPNDILIGKAKAGGILVESSRQPGGAGLAAVIGIGVNLVSHPADLEPAATHLAAHGLAVSPEDLLANLAGALDAWLERWGGGRGFAAVREAWLSRAGPLGEALSVHVGRETVRGRFAGIDGDGALLILDESGAERRYTYGDVTLPD